MFCEKVYDVMKEKNIDAIVVSDGANMRYISGFRGATGYLYISGNRRVLATDSRYTTMAKEEAPDFEIVDPGAARNYGEVLNGLMEQDGVKEVGFEDQYLLYSSYSKLQEACKGRLICCAASRQSRSWNIWRRRRKSATWRFPICCRC